MLSGLIQDVRYAVRQLRKSPSFTTIAVITLALGIGATTAVFSLVDQVLLRSLPVRNPQELVMLEMHGSDTGRISSHGGSNGQYFSYLMYRDLRDQNQVFSGMAGMLPTQVGVQWHNEPGLANAELVTGNYFDLLGVRPAIGRLFVQSDEGAKGASPVVVLSFSYWQRRFGSDPTIVDKTILVNGQPFAVVGVAAPSFKSAIAATAPDVFFTMNMKPQITPGWDDLDVRRSRWMNIVARLKPGVSVQQATAAMDPLWKALRSEEFKELTSRGEDFRKGFVDKSTLTLLEGSKGFSGFRDSTGKSLKILMGMVCLLALMAAANVAGLLLVRAAGRVREMSVRYALGAGRSRIIRQLVVEGLLLGIVGGLVGIALASLINTSLLSVMFTGSGTVPLSSAPDQRVLAFNIALSIVVALLFSITPVLQFWRPNVAPALKQQMVTATGGHVYFRRAIVGVQIALSLLLLVGAGLFVRTVHKLQTVDVGFTTEQLMTFSVDPRMAGYSVDRVGPLYRRMLDTLSSQAGVKSVAITDDPDLANNNSTFSIFQPGQDERDTNIKSAEWEHVSPSYLTTLQQPLLLGRFLMDSDQLGSAPVTVVNEEFAKQFFGGAQQAIGRSVRAGRVGEWSTIVGVVKNARHRDVRTDSEMVMYSSIFQEKEPSSVEFYVRTYQEPESAAATIRAAVRNLDSKLVLDQFQTMKTQIDGVLSTERLLAILATGFGVLAVLMAGVGLYGVLAFSTAQRTREIGIRMALGASRGMVVSMVLREVLWLAGVSLAVALPIALGLGRVVSSQLFGISGRDPVTIAGAIFIIACAGGAAAMIPARRASSIEPMKALRYE